MSAADTSSGRRRVLGKLGLKVLALLLGIMAWYLIQDAIRIESAQRKQSLDPKPSKASATRVLHLDRVPISVLVHPGGWDWQVSPAQASVWLEGSEAELGRLEKGVVRLFVDGTVIGQAGETVMLPVKVYLPPDTALKAQADPALVEVLVKPAAAKGGL